MLQITMSSLRPLQQQLHSIASEKFNGVSLFGTANNDGIVRN